MIIRLAAGASRIPDTLTRLRRNHVVLEAPADSAALDVTTAGVRVCDHQVAESGKSLDSEVTLRFDKDRAVCLVSFNPALLGILGYTPGFPAVLTAANWPDAAPLSVALSDKLTPAQAKAVEELEYVLELHTVPVGLP